MAAGSGSTVHITESIRRWAFLIIAAILIFSVWRAPEETANFLGEEAGRILSGVGRGAGDALDIESGGASGTSSPGGTVGSSGDNPDTEVSIYPTSTPIQLTSEEVALPIEQAFYAEEQPIGVIEAMPVVLGAVVAFFGLIGIVFMALSRQSGTIVPVIYSTFGAIGVISLVALLVENYVALFMLLSCIPITAIALLIDRRRGGPRTAAPRQPPPVDLKNFKPPTNPWTRRGRIEDYIDVREVS